MLSYVCDLLFVLVVVLCTALLVRRPVLDSVSIWLTILLAGLITLNSFEWVANLIISKMFLMSDVWFTSYFWFATALILFGWFSTILFICFQKALNGSELALGRFDGFGRWTFSLLSGYTLAAFLLVVAHTFPATRDFGGALPPELHKRSTPVLAFAPDYQFLTLGEYICNPRSVLAGYPWGSRGPLSNTSLRDNRWSSFPVRYAVWREANQQLQREYRYDEEDASSESDATLDDPGRLTGYAQPSTAFASSN